MQLFCDDKVYMNPVHFHTGLMVIKPDRQVYERLVQGVFTMESFDGADQGYLNSYFGRAAMDAKVFDPSKEQSEDVVNRLPLEYNINHAYWYPTLSFRQYVLQDSDVVTITYPTVHTQALKPWYLIPNNSKNVIRREIFENGE